LIEISNNSVNKEAAGVDWLHYLAWELCIKRCILWLLCAMSEMPSPSSGTSALELLATKR
jgi:hypothetical protein